MRSHSLLHSLLSLSLLSLMLSLARSPKPKELKTKISHADSLILLLSLSIWLSHCCTQVAALLAVEINKLHPLVPVHCFGYGMPACVDASLSDALQSSSVEGVTVTSVVNHDDVVPRLSVNNMRRLMAEVPLHHILSVCLPLFAPFCFSLRASVCHFPACLPLD